MKITLEETNKDPIVIETDTYFLFTDKQSWWQGVETHLVFWLNYYAEFIKESFIKKLYDK